VLLEAGLLTKRDYHAANGDDWEELEQQRYEERLLERTLSAKLPPDPNPAAPGESAGDTEVETADEEETADA
jgi:capsid protein